MANCEWQDKLDLVEIEPLLACKHFTCPPGESLAWTSYTLPALVKSWLGPDIQYIYFTCPSERLAWIRCMYSTCPSERLAWTRYTYILYLSKRKVGLDHVYICTLPALVKSWLGPDIHIYSTCPSERLAWIIRCMFSTCPSERLTWIRCILYLS